ncbi:unnamed protein product [Chrysoparadoxa australica]
MLGAVGWLGRAVGLNAPLEPSSQEAAKTVGNEDLSEPAAGPASGQSPGTHHHRFQPASNVFTIPGREAFTPAQGQRRASVTSFRAPSDTESESDSSTNGESPSSAVTISRRRPRGGSAPDASYTYMKQTRTSFTVPDSDGSDTDTEGPKWPGSGTTRPSSNSPGSPPPASCAYRGGRRITSFLERRRSSAFSASREEEGEVEELAEENGLRGGIEQEEDILVTRLAEKMRLHEKAIHERQQERLTAMSTLSSTVMLELRGERKSKDDMVRAARVALESGAQIDLGSLRALLTPENPVYERFAKDAEVSSVVASYQACEDLLKRIDKLAAGKQVQELDQCVSRKEAQRMENTPEVSRAMAVLEVAAAEAKAKAAANAAAQAKAQQDAEHAKEVALKLAKEEQQSREAAQSEARLEAATKAKRGDYEAEAAIAIAALIEPEATMAAVNSSANPNMKKARMAFKKLFKGNFNRISNDAQKIADVVNSIVTQGGDELAVAEQAGWGDEARQYYDLNLALQIISRAEGDQFNASGFEQAFQNSLVAVDLCAVNPRITVLLKGLLYRDCPYTVPRMVIDSTGLDDAALRSAMGFRESEGPVQMAARCRHLIVMCAALMQCPVSEGVDASKHPFPTSAGWAWLARVLNQVEVHAKRGTRMPLPCGPMLEGFLQIGGHTLQLAYGRQFHKVVALIDKEVLHRLVPKSTVPHLLDSVLEEYKRAGNKFPPPPGRAAVESFRPWGKT